MFTTVLTAAGVAVFIVVARRSKTPVLTYRRIALATLLLSFVPDLALPLGPLQAPWSGAIVLMIMHLAAWWATVQALTNLSARRGE
jgi:hypothetical protein